MDMEALLGPDYHSLKCLQIPAYWENVIVFNGKYYPCRDFDVDIIDDMMYRFRAPDMDKFSIYSGHPLVGWAYNKLYKLYLHDPGRDLTDITDPWEFSRYWLDFKSLQEVR